MDVQEQKMNQVNEVNVAEDNEVNDANEVNKKERHRKKKNHRFEHHIRKILKEISAEHDITQQAKSQLNDLAVITCKIVYRKMVDLLQSNQKKTITEKEIEVAVKLIFTGQLAANAISEGKKSLQNYLSNAKSTTLKGQSRHTKADIIIPPSVPEKLLRDSATTYHIGTNAPVFLAGVIEYFLSQIIELAIVKNKNHIRLTVQDLENGVRSDLEMSSYFNQYKIYFYNSGMQPFIHPNILNRNGKNDKKSVKTIVKLQEKNNNVFSKRFIEQLCKHYISLILPDVRYQKDCFNYLHDYLEKWITEILQSSNILTIYGKKSRVNSQDIEMVMSIIENRVPSFLECVNTDETSDDNVETIENIEEESSGESDDEESDDDESDE
jgi:histone H3/H4